MVNLNQKILVSVVIPTLNREKLLLETLKKLICQKFMGFEVIVVDQSDLELPSVRKFVLEHQNIIRFFRIAERGLPNARNFGVSQAKGEIIIFCDDDVIPLDGFLQSHFNNYADMNISGVAGRVLCPDEKTKGHSLENNSHKIAKTRWLNLHQYDNFNAQIRTEAHHAQGCNMSFRRSVINELGGFDTRFGGSAHLEETDFCMRVRSAGYKMIFEPRAALVHLKDSAGGCRARNWEDWFYWYGHNHALLYSKNTRNPLLLMAIKGFHILISSLRRGRLLLFSMSIKGMREGFHSSKKITDSKRKVAVQNNLRMKTLLITNDYPPIISGISTVFYNIWKLLPRDRFWVLAPSTVGAKKIDRESGINLIRYPFLPHHLILLKFINLCFMFLYTLWTLVVKKCHKIHAGQILTSGIIALTFKKTLKVPYYLWVYGGETTKAYSTNPIIFSLMKRVINGADKIITNSPFTTREFLEYGIPKRDMVEVLPAVDTQLFHPSKRPHFLKQKFHLNGKQILLTVARLAERKGHDQVLKALSLLTHEFPDLVYVMVGKGYYEGRLMELVREYNLEEKVVFSGFVRDQDLPYYYNLCDIYVMPNREVVTTTDSVEGFGIAFIEANSCGKPVIGGKSGGVKAAIADGVTGFLVDPYETPQLVEKIKILLQDKNLSKNMGKKARERVLKEFSWEDRAWMLQALSNEKNQNES